LSSQITNYHDRLANNKESKLVDTCVRRHGLWTSARPAQ
jgi:hypothetical protein